MNKLVHGLSDICLLYNTVKYMNGRQWIYRVRNTLLKKIPRKAFISNVETFIPTGYLYYSDFSDTESVALANKVLNNKFPTISDIFPFFPDGKIDWDLSGNDYRLICFRFNSFKYLLYLSDAYKVTKEIKYIEKGFQLINDWNSQCGKLIKGDKWNPYVIAERLMNWIGFYSTYSEYGTSSIVSWIASQAKELRNTIEYQMGANHLLSEARALMYTGNFLNDKNLYEYGKELLKDEFKEQFLCDGGNYERSISYHIEALQQYFEATMLMEQIADEDFETFRYMLIKPYVFLNAMIGADKHIPLINDAALDYPFEARDFLNTSHVIFGDKAPNGIEGAYCNRWSSSGRKNITIEWKTDSFHKETGFLMEHYRVKEKEYSLFFDVGDIGADVNPGHAHADSLNILWATEDKPIFVDSGVYTYKPGRERDICRGTAAHNTIEIDGMNSSEVWAAFRVGRRARVRIKEYRNTKDTLEIEASHNGYTKVLKKPIVHNRRIKLDKKTGEIIIEDFLSGKGSHEAVLRFHLAPGCDIELDKNIAIIDNKYRVLCSEQLLLDDCNIAEFFGKPQQSLCLATTVSLHNDNKLIITKISILENNRKRGK